MDNGGPISKKLQITKYKLQTNSKLQCPKLQTKRHPCIHAIMQSCNIIHTHLFFPSSYLLSFPSSLFTPWPPEALLFCEFNGFFQNIWAICPFQSDSPPHTCNRIDDKSELFHYTPIRKIPDVRRGIKSVALFRKTLYQVAHINFQDIRYFKYKVENILEMLLFLWY